ncbi:hypothetical protein [Nonomuraea angiospora]
MNGSRTAPAGRAAAKAGLLLSGEPQPLGEREVALFKPRWGAFYRTRLDADTDGRPV